MRAAVYCGYGIRPEVTQVADPACPADLVGRVIGLEAAGRALAAMDGPLWKPG